MTPWLLAPATAWQLGRVRQLVVAYCFVWSVARLPFWIDQARLPDRRHDPVGLLSLTGDRFALPAIAIIFAVTAGAGILAFLGRAWPSSGIVFALGFLALTTHGNSYGQILHTEQLPVLHLLVLAAGPAGCGYRSRRDPGPADVRFGWPLRVLSLVTVMTYMVAGVAKIRFGGEPWFRGETLRILLAEDNLRKDLLGDPSSPLAPLVLRLPWLFGPAVAGSLIIELGAPLALINRRLAILWCGAAWLFHATVLATMAVLFLYPLLGLAFVPLISGYGNREP